MFLRINELIRQGYVFVVGGHLFCRQIEIDEERRRARWEDSLLYNFAADHIDDPETLKHNLFYDSYAIPPNAPSILTLL